MKKKKSKLMSMAGNASLFWPLKKCLFIMSCICGDADWCRLDETPHAHGEVGAVKQPRALFPIYFM